ALGALGQRREVAVVQRVGGELRLQRRRRRARTVGQLVQRGREPLARRAVAAEQVLARRAPGHEARADLRERGRHEGQQVLQRAQRLLEPARRGERGREREEQLQPVLRVVGGQQPQRGGVPARRLC